MPKYVVSSTLSEPLEWNNATVVRGDPAAQVGRLKHQDPGPILAEGSHTLVHSLIENDLVDEYCLMVFPVVIADGKRLWPDVRDKKPLKLVDVNAFSSGVVVHTYRPA